MEWEGKKKIRNERENGILREDEREGRKGVDIEGEWT